MADEDTPAPAEEQPAVAAEPVGDDVVEGIGGLDVAPAPEPTKADRIAALIRNGLCDTAVSRDAASWQALETRLPEIVAAILQEA